MATVNLVIQITTKYSGWGREEVDLLVSYIVGKLFHTLSSFLVEEIAGVCKIWFLLVLSWTFLSRNYEGKVKNILLILISASNLNFFYLLFSFSFFLSHLCAKCLLEILKFSKDTLVKRLLSKSVSFMEKMSGSSYCHDNGITLSHVMFIHGK